MNGCDFPVVHPSALPVILTTVALFNALLPFNIIRQVSIKVKRGVEALTYERPPWAL